MQIHCGKGEGRVASFAGLAPRWKSAPPAGSPDVGAGFGAARFCASAIAAGLPEASHNRGAGGGGHAPVEAAGGSIAPAWGLPVVAAAGPDACAGGSPRLVPTAAAPKRANAASGSEAATADAGGDRATSRDGEPAAAENRRVTKDIPEPASKAS
jgi:hypothetical protein